MKLSIANPTTGATKILEIDDEKKLSIFYDKKIGHEVNADPLGDEFKGYIFKITGGNDKQGFPMMNGVLTSGRVRILLKPGHPCFRPRRDGQRKRKSVRGCIVGPDMSVLQMIVVKKGDGELPGLTDKFLPRKMGPRRASKIRKLFNLTKEDDVRKYVIKRVWKKVVDGKVVSKRVKAPRIQRLVTPARLARKRYVHNVKVRHAAKMKLEAAEYAKLVAQRKKALKDRKNKSSRRASSKVSVNAATVTTPAAVPAKAPAKKDKKDKKDKTAAKAPAKVAAGAKKAPAKGAAKPAVAKTAAAKGAPVKDVSAKKAPAKTAASPATTKAAAKPAAAKAAAKAAPVAKEPAKQAAKPAAPVQKKSAPKKK